MAAYTTIKAAQNGLVTAITTAGLNATADPRKVLLPGAIVRPVQRIRPEVLRASTVAGTGYFVVHLVHPGPDDKVAADWLQDNLPEALVAAPPDGDCERILTSDYSADGTLMPAYEWLARTPISVTVT